jgi:hypothetical protein
MLIPNAQQDDSSLSMPTDFDLVAEREVVDLGALSCQFIGAGSDVGGICSDAGAGEVFCGGGEAGC